MLKTWLKSLRLAKIKSRLRFGARTPVVKSMVGIKDVCLVVAP